MKQQKQQKKFILKFSVLCMIPPKEWMRLIKETYEEKQFLQPITKHCEPGETDRAGVYAKIQSENLNAQVHT